jgi:REP element-mobilizing transposase RayT
MKFFSLFKKVSFFSDTFLKKLRIKRREKSFVFAKMRWYKLSSPERQRGVTLKLLFYRSLTFAARIGDKLLGLGFGFEKNMECPIAYLITFTTYGTWLHGDKRNSVNNEHNRVGYEFVPPNPGLNTKEHTLLKNPPIKLNTFCRGAVLQAILEVCKFRDWFAHSVHVRSNHVHIVVSGQEKPEKMMRDFKGYGTRAIKKSGIIFAEKYWTRHGSTKYLWTKEQLQSAIEYVKNGQGKIMAYGKTEPQA